MDIHVILVLFLVIIAALAFEYINGFHDCANAIATVVSTKVLTPKQAVVISAALNLVGALLGTHVAKTIGSGIVDSSVVTLKVLFFALLGAIIWNLITWFFALPSSSSHALIGGLIGAAVVHAGHGCVKISSLVDKVIIPMFTSPVFGFVAGFLFMLLLLWLFYKSSPDWINKHFRKYQLISACLMALSHGTNDAQKTMGIISLALLSCGIIGAPSGDLEIPKYVVIACAVTMAAGTMSGGWKIIKTIGSKIIRLKPIHGFAAETSAATIIIAASHFGIPLSTTHVISTSIMGVGSTLNANQVKWGIVKNIVFAWVMTIPMCMAISASLYYLYNLVF